MLALNLARLLGWNTADQAKKERHGSDDRDDEALLA